MIVTPEVRFCVDDAVGPGAAVDVVGTGPAVDDVEAAAAVDHVVAAQTADHVGAGRPVQRVVARGSRDRAGGCRGFLNMPRKEAAQRGSRESDCERQRERASLRMPTVTPIPSRCIISGFREHRNAVSAATENRTPIIPERLRLFPAVRAFGFAVRDSLIRRRIRFPLFSGGRLPRGV